MADIYVVHVQVTNLTHADECSADPMRGMTGFGHNPESLLEAVGHSEAGGCTRRMQLTHSLIPPVFNPWNLQYE